MDDASQTMTSRRTPGDGEGDSSSRRRRTEYNLEKPPLQTVEIEANPDLRTRAATGLGLWGVSRRTAALIALVVIVILLVMGTWIVQLLGQFLSRAYEVN